MDLQLGLVTARTAMLHGPRTREDGYRPLQQVATRRFLSDSVRRYDGSASLQTSWPISIHYNPCGSHDGPPFGLVFSTDSYGPARPSISRADSLAFRSSSCRLFRILAACRCWSLGRISRIMSSVIWSMIAAASAGRRAA